MNMNILSVLTPPYIYHNPLWGYLRLLLAIHTFSIPKPQLESSFSARSDSIKNHSLSSIYNLLISNQTEPILYHHHFIKSAP